jgi:hypothetical protein
LKSQFVSASDQVEILAVDVECNSRVRVIVVYNPNTIDTYYFTKFSGELRVLCSKNYPFITMGDFNLPNIYWNNLTFHEVKCYALFADLFFELQPLEQVVKQPTREKIL